MGGNKMETSGEAFSPETTMVEAKAGPSSGESCLLDRVLQPAAIVILRRIR